MPDPRAVTRAVLDELSRLAERDANALPGFHPVAVGEVLDRASTQAVVADVVELDAICAQLTALRVPARTAAVVADTYGRAAAQHGIAVTARTAPAAPARPPAAQPPPAAAPATRPLPAGNLPESLPVALADLVTRHDRIHDVDPAAARAFFAHDLDRAQGRAVDLTSVFVWLQGRGVDSEALHEIVLSLSAVGHALGHRMALPAVTSAVKPADRARLLQAFVKRCPQNPPPAAEAANGKPTAPPPPIVDDDYMVSVVTNTLVRERRKRTAAVAAAIGGVLALAVALAATLVLGDEEAPSELDLPPPPDDAASTSEGAANDDKRTRAMARFAVRAAEEHLTAGDLDSARTEAERARELDPAYAETSQVLSVVEQRAGNAAEACRHMKDYVRLSEKTGAVKKRLLRSACQR